MGENVLLWPSLPLSRRLGAVRAFWRILRFLLEGCPQNECLRAARSVRFWPNHYLTSLVSGLQPYAYWYGRIRVVLSSYIRFSYEKFIKTSIQHNCNACRGDCAVNAPWKATIALENRS